MTYPEPLVSRVLGPKKLILVTVRRTMLKKGPHWTLVDSVVHYTAEGLTALCRSLDLDQQPVLDEMEKISPGSTPPRANAGPAAPAAAPLAEASPSTPEPSLPPVANEGEKISPVAPPPVPAEPTHLVDVFVTGRSPNPLIVFGTLDGEPVKVRVRNNTTFLRGLIIRAHLSKAGHYLMVGNPPRWLGDKHGFTRPTAVQPEPQKIAQ